MPGIGGVSHCVEPVPRAAGVPMARFEPAHTAWAMSKPPSMAMEAREIGEGLILVCGNRTRLKGCSGDKKHVLPEKPSGDNRFDFIYLTSLHAHLHA